MLYGDSPSSTVGRDYRGEVLHRACMKLLDSDPDIVEIVFFGSPVYAPELSRDVDLPVVSTNPKGYNAYTDAVDEVNCHSM